MLVFAVLLLVVLSASAQAQESTLEKMRRCKEHFNHALQATQLAPNPRMGAHLDLWAVFTACIKGEEPGSGEEPVSVQSDVLDPAAMTPEQKERFNKLYEEALKAGNLLEFLTNWTKHEGKASQGQVDLCNGIDKTQKHPRDTCRKVLAMKLKEAKAANQTIIRNVVMRECYKIENPKAARVKRCLNATAEACSAAGLQGNAFDAKNFYATCIQRPDPTTTRKPVTTRTPRIYRLCRAAYNKLVANGKKPAVELNEYIAVCVQRRQAYTVCFNKYQQLVKTQTDLSKNRYINGCIKKRLAVTTAMTRPSTTAGASRPPTTDAPTIQSTPVATRPSTTARPMTTA